MKSKEFSKSLKLLNIGGLCGVGQNSINELDLVELYACDNDKVSHLKSLKILGAGGTCGIGQNEIEKLNLVELFVWNNKNITNVSHMKSKIIFEIIIYFRCGWTLRN